MRFHPGECVLNFCILALLLSCPSAPALTDDSQLWLSATASGALAEKSPYGGYLEYQIRHSDDQKQLFQTFLRPAFYRQINDHLSIWLGFLSLRKQDFSETEQRLWQQATYSDKWLDISYSFRVRQEQRFYKEAKDDKAAQNKTRIQARVVGPLIGKVMPLIWDELHWNWDSSRGRSEAGYDQNRIFVGVTANILETTLLDVGYLNVNVRRLNAEDLMVNGLSVTMAHRW